MCEQTKTNTEDLSKKTCQLDCKTLWSNLQDKAYTQVATRTIDAYIELTTNRPPDTILTSWEYERLIRHYEEKLSLSSNGKANDDKKQLFIPSNTMIDNYTLRAKRIAGTYARIYLEQKTEAGTGDVTKKGRFYWMGLGAFASKTVKCTLEGFRTNKVPSVNDALGKGNLWLFIDVAPWHWFFINHRACFEHCLEDRAVPEKLSSTLQADTKKVGWYDKVKPHINSLKVTKEVRKAFKLSDQIETTTKKTDRRKFQLDHLLALAIHEQNNILQKIIYTGQSNQDFLFWLRRGRGVASYVLPDLKLVFASACSTKNPRYESIPPKGNETVLEDYDKRMDWINEAAKQYHGLMDTDAKYMEAELQTMANWWVPR